MSINSHSALNSSAKPVRTVSFKWNAIVVRTGSCQIGPIHGLEALNSPPSGRPSALSGELWREDMCALALFSTSIQFHVSRVWTFGLILK